MGKPRTFPNITTSDCKKILDVIQKDLELRRKEDEQLSKIQEEVNEQAVQRNVLSKRKEFNEKYCILCCSAFNLLFRRKIRCQGCLFLVCRSCATYDVSFKAWICVVCEKQRHLDIECSTWFYNRIKQKFKLFGAAKVLETHCRKRRASDSENDSGYGHLTDVRPLQTLFSSNSSHSVSSMAGSITLEEEEDVDEEDAEIHHSIETIIEALLGSTLDDALVDHMYSHVLYNKIFSLCHGPLVKSIRNLSEALRRALCNLPHEDKDTPTVAHAALKHIISQVINECLDLPDLRLSDRNNWNNETVSHEIKGSDIFASYDSLVAAAIINKIVEEAQSKFVKQQEISVLSLDNMKTENGDLESQGTPGISIEEDFTTFDLPLEYVQVEEVEEITKEYTDSEDDKFSSISHQSSGLHSVEEFGLCKESSEIGLPSVSEISDSDKIPFPEFGRDLVEDASIAEGDSTYLPTAVTSWEENWLFRKKKRMPLYSNLKYQLLTYCDDPPYMLIPCPSESPHPVDILEYDELSELSESHSVGSLELSSESDESMGGKNNCYGSFVAEHDKKDVSSTLQTFQEIIKPDGPQNASLSPDGNSYIKSVNKEQLEGAIKCEGDTEVIFKNQECYIKEHQTTVDEDFSTAPRPGTIAEREHKKWMNAVPLKNNPYSAENIKRRFSRPQKRVLKEHASSFEEFEKEFIDTSSDVVDKQTYENKLDCGPKCIDVDLYKRDYYINELWKDGSTVKRSHFNQHLPLEPFDDNHDLVTDETLNSLEEKVYISSGKVFTLENHVKRLERELKDVSLSSTDVSSIPPSLQYCSQQVLEDVRNQLANSTSEEDLPSLPSVKTLATKFNSHHQAKYVKNIENGKHNVRRFRENSKEHNKAKSEETLKVKKSKPCMKVHSLTARSLSREFRVMAHQNLPRPMNRTVSVPSQASDEFASEQESVSSVSFPSPVCESRTPVIPDIVHGYTSDESSTSTNSLPRLKVRKNISRSILQRASYWERRLEQGLLSDASVNEEFPAVDINPD